MTKIDSFHRIYFDGNFSDFVWFCNYIYLYNK